jgi:hypothetical protein
LAWPGADTAFIWNDDVVISPGVDDGVLFRNIPGAGETFVRVGNIILNPSVINDESLPRDNFSANALMILEMGNSSGGAWLSSRLLTLTLAPEPPPDPSDFDGNGMVDGDDLAALLENFGDEDADSGQGDADSDQDVDGADFLIWQEHLGAGANMTKLAAAVPEPMSWRLAALGALLPCRLRGKRIGSAKSLLR